MSTVKSPSCEWLLLSNPPLALAEVVPKLDIMFPLLTYWSLLLQKYELNMFNRSVPYQPLNKFKWSTFFNYLSTKNCCSLVKRESIQYKLYYFRAHMNTSYLTYGQINGTMNWHIYFLINFRFFLNYIYCCMKPTVSWS